MSAADVAVGMMDGAYFTSRNELLSFFNTTFNLNLTKIEQTASGAVACQLTEYLFPGSIPMSKVNWAAKSSHEYVGNYKLLQKAFTKNKVQRYVDVDKLIRGKYQDNLEFCQWLKAFFDMQNGAGGRDDYDPVAVRAKGKGGKTVGTNSSSGSAGSRARVPVSRPASSSSGRSGNAPVVGKPRIGSSTSSSSLSGARSSAPSAAATTSRSSPPRRARSSTSTTSTTATTASSARPTRPVTTQKENTTATNNNLPTTSRKQPTPSTTTTSSVSSAQIKKYQDEITQLKSQHTTLQTKYTNLEILSTELEMNIASIESERDFYFEKLRGIEVMLQVYKEKEESGEIFRGGEGDGGEMKRVIDKIFKVMYAAAEDNVAVDDEGNLIGDITIDESLVHQSNVSIESFRPQAQDEIVPDDEEEEELLTSGIVDPAAVNVADERVKMDPLSDDDDEELLTSGIISPPVNPEVMLASNDVNVSQQLLPDLDGEDDDDEELLTSGIVDEVAEDGATNRDAENARIISQLVGDNDIGDEDLLADDASQDEY